MADLYRSRHRLTWMTTHPDTGARDLQVLCNYTSWLTTQLTWAGAVTVQRDAILRDPWVHQHARGGASLSLSLGVATRWHTSLEAEHYLDDMQLYMLTHPGGLLRVESYPDWDTGRPTRDRTWEATLDQADPAPLTGETDYGPADDDTRRAWAVMTYKFTLSRPHPDTILTPAPL